MKSKNLSTTKPHHAAPPKVKADVAAAPKPPAPPEGKGATTAAEPERAVPTGSVLAREKKPVAPRGMSGLEAAVKVLVSSREPMGCGEIMERILAQKLWSTSGKTPAATLNAAIIREIRDKGKESRFKKVGRGKFTSK